MTTYDPAAFILDDSRPKVFVYDTALGGITRTAFERSEHRPTSWWPTWCHRTLR